MMAGEFAQTLTWEGFEPPVTMQREAHGQMDVHPHPFEAKALILAGEIRMATQGTERSYRSGDSFHVPANKPHAESSGPEGVTSLVGRKTA